MKTTMLMGWRWMFTVFSAVAFLGCLNETSGTSAEAVPTDVSTTATNTFEASEVPPQHAVIAPADLSPGIAEIVKLAQSGVGEEVLVAYVEKSGRTFNPTVDEIVYLKDLGLSETVLAALVRKGNLTNEVAVATNTVESVNTNAILSAQAVSNAPSLTDPAAPSYSVASAAEQAEIPTVTPPEVNVNYFESTLAPYGSWVEVADYGRCWQPTVVIVNRNWRPYADRGRWVYTSCGWYWQSDYSWGWAAFHYGRWHQDHRVGWVWVPGSTWGPAWVSWRYTDQYCGWAPLPPSAHYVSGAGFRYHNASVGISFDFGLRDDCYTFIPTSRFCDPSPHRYYASRSHSTTIYRNSVVINNYIRGNNNTVINEGIGRNRISSATRTPIRTVALRDVSSTSAPVGRAERLQRDGSLAVFRPGVTRTSLARPTQSSPTTSVAARASTLSEHTSSSRITASRSLTTPRTTSTSPTRTTIPHVSAPAPSAAPNAATAFSTPRTTFPRTWTRTAPQTTPTPSQPTASTPSANVVENTATPSVRNGNGSSSRQVLPVVSGRSSSTEIPRGAVSQPRSVTPRNVPTPTTVTPPASRPETRIPTVTPPSRPQPSWREQRSSVADQNVSASMQRASRSIVTAPAPSAPVVRPQPAQPQSQPRFETRQAPRGLGRIENSAPPRSQPAPSVSAPRSSPAPQVQSAPAPREQRGLGRSGRDRN